MSGPSPQQAAKSACPAIQPKEPALRAAVRSLGHGAYRVTVSSSIASMGANEGSVDRSPVDHAAVRPGTVVTFTNRAGVAIVRVRRSRRLTVTAGDTLRPASLVIGR